MLGCSEEDSAELGLPGTAGGGLLEEGKSLLRFPGVRVPVRLFDVEIGGALGNGGLEERDPPSCRRIGR